ncbi:hypothetical protein SAMN05216410_1485 [Sanguibacter gelidistatuariae]|uniref:SnoaL-like domain-containing protein n=1 Tax=Sanguibacter gelidistatuariae TaxID=1814289 RepID=A0A1G6K302_9MICO|nr:nuclear transport factor 2 family protein [Sanguibacter gelidistatuariae]SDC25241.1 hypothetical protein SAMN05216410_1485 [Sanguibacter gelidistatuariae]
MSPDATSTTRQSTADHRLVGTADPAVGHAFLRAYAARDWDSLRALFHADVTWDLPGRGPISGRAAGVEAVIDRVRRIVDGGTRTQLLHVLTGSSGVALLLHNTGRKADGRLLDEHLITLLRTREDQIAAVETYLSDIEMMQAFFAEPPTT